MSIEKEAQKLLGLRSQLDQYEHQYDDQRLVVHNALVNAHRDFIEIDGFKIAHVPESTVMAFRQELLHDELLRRGLNEADVAAVVAASKAEMPRDSILRITKTKKT